MGKSILRRLTVLALLLSGSSTVLADAIQDCANLRGDAAIQACTEAIRQNPRDAQSSYNRGVRYMNDKHDLDRALSDYNKAIAIDPKHASAYNNRSYINLKKGNFDLAIADATKAIDIDPRKAPAYGLRGVAYERKHDFDRALAAFTKAIEIDPKLGASYASRARLRAKFNRDLPLALSDCDTAIGLRPNEPSYLDVRGLVFLRLSRFDESIAVYSEALKIEPERPESLYGRGLAKRKNGDRAGGDADIAAAKATRADIADELVKHGIN